MTTRYWFKPKRYGYGARPVTWEGWLLVVAYVAVAAGLATLIAEGARHRNFGEMAVAASLAAAALAVFFGLMRRKTEGGWKWRWGDRD